MHAWTPWTHCTSEMLHMYHNVIPNVQNVACTAYSNSFLNNHCCCSVLSSLTKCVDDGEHTSSTYMIQWSCVAGYSASCNGQAYLESNTYLCGPNIYGMKTYDMNHQAASYLPHYLATAMSPSAAWEKAPTSAPSCSFSLVPYASRYSTSAILSIRSILMLFGISIRNTHLQSA